MTQKLKHAATTFMSSLKAGVLSTLATVAVLVTIAIATIYFLPRSWVCGQHEVIKESYSPNGEYKAITFLSECGATTAFTINVSIIKANDHLSPNQLGNVFQGPQGSTSVEVEWNSDSSLVIKYPSYYVENRTMKSEIYGVLIEYQEYIP